MALHDSIVTSDNLADSRHLLHIPASSRGHAPTRPRSHKHIISQLAPRDCASLLTAQQRAHQLLALPSKARAFYFSPQEQAQILLAGATSDLVLDVADSALSHLRARSRSPRPLHLPQQQQQQQQQRLKPSSSTAELTALPPYRPSPPPRRHDRDQRDSSHAHALAQPHEAASCVQESWRACTSLIEQYNHRTMQLSCISALATRRNLHGGGDVDVAPRPSSHISNASSAPRPSLRLLTKRLSSQQDCHSHGPVTLASASVSPSRYYQDPDARANLRTYLATPHKFDEALEHGFPISGSASSSASASRCSSSFPTSSSTSHESATPSFSSSSSSSPPTTWSTNFSAFETPALPLIVTTASTPLAIAALPRSLRRRSAIPASLLPHTSPPPPSSAPPPPSGGSPREMTMKLSLTRPDLRLQPLPGAPRGKAA